ncbi:hypothetical protein FDK21_17860 [Cohaesibacter sp. CAU 1516]|uniref:hypothetical protein n=1 Tax=Cohaesibacter sp. CAU 1516 TaxID=2576038 RepID=UPI0010FE54FC|nr:hypothetical protein [Cohaesibacter sp. CAU 1516]TLP43421.1 hypothetical protein FDK21_17860 [Cohaesibacter sp. CAU 1516]
MDDWPINYDPNDFLTPIEKPTLDAQSIYNIGLIMVWWSLVEAEIDIMFVALFRLDPTHALSITENMTSKAKISSLQAAARSLASPLGDELSDKIKELLDSTAHYSVNVRNLLAHGKFVAGKNELLKFSAHGKLKLRVHDLDAAVLIDIANQIEELANDIRSTIPEIVDVVKSMTAKDFDEFVLINE